MVCHADVVTAMSRAAELKHQEYAFLAKTRICKFHMKGKCKRGEACTFAHGDTQLRAQPNLVHTRLCYEFVRTGACHVGDRCKYAHGEEQLRDVAKRESGARAARAGGPSSVAEQTEDLMQQIRVMEAYMKKLRCQLTVASCPGGLTEPDWLSQQATSSPASSAGAVVKQYSGSASECPTIGFSRQSTKDTGSLHHGQDDDWSEEEGCDYASVWENEVGFGSAAADHGARGKAATPTEAAATAGAAPSREAGGDEQQEQGQEMRHFNFRVLNTFIHADVAVDQGAGARRRSCSWPAPAE